jgi:hypothetical protein
MKNLLLILGIICLVYVGAKSQILNGSFEEVEYIDSSGDSVLYPKDWWSGSPEFDGYITTDSYSGEYAMYLKSWYQGNNTVYFYNGDSPVRRFGSTEKNKHLEGAGTPIDELPSELKGYYKFQNVKPNDSMIVTVYVKRYIEEFDSIHIVGYGRGEFPETELYEEFTVPLVKHSEETPDSIIIQIETSTNVNFCQGVECNYLTIDDFSLEYAVDTEELILNRIEVFPNPFSDKVRITSENGIEKIVVSDLSGRMILSETTFGMTKELDLSGFDSGVLILTIIDEEGIKNNYKLIKMN